MPFPRWLGACARLWARAGMDAARAEWCRLVLLLRGSDGAVALPGRVEGVGVGHAVRGGAALVAMPGPHLLTLQRARIFFLASFGVQARTPLF